MDTQNRPVAATLRTSRQSLRKDRSALRTAATLAFHLKADELSDAAKARNRDKALAHLSELINNCNTCHIKFRH